MKKILFTILTMFIFVNTVKANEWQEELIEGINVETEYRYRFYKEEKEGEYLGLSQDNDYQFEDKNDFIYGDYSSYQETCTFDEGYEIDYATKYIYKELLPIGFIKITNFGDSELNIANIEPIEKDVLLTYDFSYCTDCSNDNYTINPNGELIIKFEKLVNFRDLKLILEFFDTGNIVEYELVYATDNLFSTISLVALINGRSNYAIYESTDNFKLFNNYTLTKTGFDILVDEYVKVSSVNRVCRAREKMTYHYNITKNYYDENYYKDVEELIDLTSEEKLNYKKDLKDFKIFYRYNENINSNEEIIKEEYTNVDTISNNLIPVKTGIDEKKLNYNYLIMYVLSLILVSLILIKRIKSMSIKNNN